VQLDRSFHLRSSKRSVVFNFPSIKRLAARNASEAGIVTYLAHGSDKRASLNCFLQKLLFDVDFFKIGFKTDALPRYVLTLPSEISSLGEMSLSVEASEKTDDSLLVDIFQKIESLI